MTEKKVAEDDDEIAGKTHGSVPISNRENERRKDEKAWRRIVTVEHGSVL